MIDLVQSLAHLTAASIFGDFSAISRKNDRGCIDQSYGINFRSTPDRTLLFPARLDRQIQARRHRVEPSEIESVRLEQSAISAADEVRLKYSAEGKCPPRYLAGSNGGSAATIQSELPGSLRMQLPAYKVPSAAVFIAKFQASPIGKTYVKVLSLRPLSQDSTAVVERQLQQNGIEQALLEIWCEVLKREAIVMTENFFDLGGTSLSVMRVSARISDELGIDFPVSKLFQRPTIKSQASAIEGYQSTLHSSYEMLHMLDEIDAVGPAERGE